MLCRTRRSFMQKNLFVFGVGLEWFGDLFPPHRNTFWAACDLSPHRNTMCTRRRVVSTMRALSLPTGLCCASHHIVVVMAVAKIVEETDLSVSRQLGNPVAGWGHHEAPGVAGIRAIQTHANQVPYHRGSLERMARGGWQLAKGMAFAVGLPIRCMYRCTE